MCPIPDGIIHTPHVPESNIPFSSYEEVEQPKLRQHATTEWSKMTLKLLGCQEEITCLIFLQSVKKWLSDIVSMGLMFTRVNKTALYCSYLAICKAKKTEPAKNSSFGAYIRKNKERLGLDQFKISKLTNKGDPYSILFDSVKAVVSIPSKILKVDTLKTQQKNKLAQSKLSDMIKKLQEKQDIID